MMSRAIRGLHYNFIWNHIYAYLDLHIVTTPSQLCRYCPLWSPYSSWFCSFPGCAEEKASTHWREIIPYKHILMCFPRRCGIPWNARPPFLGHYNVIDIVIPQFDWLCDVCWCVMSPTSGIYWVELGFINNYKEPQLWLVLLKYSADVASAFSWVVTYGIRASPVIPCGLRYTTLQSRP